MVAVAPAQLETIDRVEERGRKRDPVSSHETSPRHSRSADKTVRDASNAATADIVNEEKNSMESAEERDQSSLPTNDSSVKTGQTATGKSSKPNTDRANSKGVAPVRFGSRSLSPPAANRRSTWKGGEDEEMFKLEVIQQYIPEESDLWLIREAKILKSFTRIFPPLPTEKKPVQSEIGSSISEKSSINNGNGKMVLHVCNNELKDNVC